jgi:hypothetical protein
VLQRRYAAASLLLFVFLLTRAQLDHVALQPNRLCQRNAVRSHSSHTRQKCFIVLQLSSFAHDSIVTFCRSYPPESDRERRIRFVSEVNAMASIRSKHTVPLLGIMFGVQGQEDSLGLSIGTESIDKSTVAVLLLTPVCRLEWQVAARVRNSKSRRRRHEAARAHLPGHAVLLAWQSGREVEAR